MTTNNIQKFKIPLFATMHHLPCPPLLLGLLFSVRHHAPHHQTQSAADQDTAQQFIVDERLNDFLCFFQSFFQFLVGFLFTAVRDVPFGRLQRTFEFLVRLGQQNKHFVAALGSIRMMDFTQSSVSLFKRHPSFLHGQIQHVSFV
jgi:hypothetical protein